MKVVIFGNRDFAQLAHYYLQHETNGEFYDVVGFTVHSEFMNSAEFDGLPVEPFEEVHRVWSPDEYQMFAPINYGEPRRRQKIYDDIKQKGYNMPTYVHPTVNIPSVSSVGENCFILEDSTIQPFVTIGDNCVLWSGNHIGHHSVIDSHVMFTSHVVLSGHCKVESHSFFGVNATVRDGTTIGEGTLIGMGSLVTKDTMPWHVYLGSPAAPKKKIV